VATGADQIAVGCPFCRVMLSDGLTAAQSQGTAREEVEVLDVAQMLLASVKGEVATRMKPGEGGVAVATKPVETKAEPEAGDVTQTDDTVTRTEDVGPAAKASGGGSSLFDTPTESETAAPEKAPAEEASAAKAAPSGGGGSLFDLGGGDQPAAKAEPAKSEPAKSEPAKPAESAPASGGSLFDLGG